MVESNNDRSIGVKSKRAAKIQWSISIIGKIIGLLSSIVLARLLMPEDYGYLTLSLIFTGLITILGDFGFQTFIIQLEDSKDETIHSTFFLDIGISMVIAILLYVSANFAASFYKIELLSKMLRLYSIAIFLSSLTRTVLATKKRTLDFSIPAKAELLFTSFSSVGKILFAFTGLGALCFPLGDLVGHIVKIVFTYYSIKFIPNLRKVSNKSLKEVVFFGSKIMLTSIGTYFANQLDKILITSNFTMATVGLYSFGQNQVSGMYTASISPLNQVFLATFSRLKNDNNKLRSVVSKVTQYINLVTLPLLVLGLIKSDAIILVVFGPKWMGANLLFKLFCTECLVRSFFVGITGIPIAIGYPSLAAKTKLINSAIFISIMFVCTFFEDIIFYGLGYLAASIIMALYNFKISSSLIRLKFKSHVWNFKENLLVGALAITVLVSIDFVTFSSHVWLDLLLKSVLFILIYFGLHYVLNKNNLLNLISLILSREEKSLAFK